MNAAAARRWALAGGAAVALWLTLPAAWRGLSLPDEGRYVGVALEMLRSGDWLVPTLDGLPFLHKPPLFYWITAAALALGGPALLAARAASLLAALLMAGTTGWFALRWLGRGAATGAVAALVTMPLFFGAAQFANMDMLVAACMSAALLCLAHGLLLDGQGAAARAALRTGWGFVGLGILAKGLVALVLPLAVLAAWTVQRRGGAAASRADLGRLLAGGGPLLAAAIALPWFVAVERRHPGFLDYFVLEQHVRRYAGSGFNNPQPFWFYLPVVAGLTLPWTPFVARPAVPTADGDARRPIRALCWWWCALVLLFFSWPKSKMVGYVLPVLPPIALLAADRVAAQGGRARVAVLSAAVLLCGVLLTAVAAVQRAGGRDHAALAAALDREAPAGEPVFALELQPYDLGFQARVARPVVLVADWGDPAIAARDDWRKELADAARFAPARAAQTLLDPRAAQRAWCARADSWVVTGLDTAARHPATAGLAPRAVTKRAGLWHLEHDRLARSGLCP